MNIAVVGTGYVGLVTATCLASLGHDVVGIDIDAAKVERLRGGEPGIYEVGLDELLRSELDVGRIRFATDLADAADAQLLLIAVGTPQGPAGDADLSALYAVVRAAAEHAAPGTVMVTKSTVPAGTGAAIRKVLAELGRDDITVGSNPEFLRQGTAVEDFLHPDRIVLGADDPSALERLRDAYAPILDRAPIVETNVITAELIKYAANAFLATKLAYVNEMADLCEAVGASIDDVTAAVGLDARIAPSYMQAGPGFGGSCLPKDTQALLHTFSQAGTTTRMVSAAVTSNRSRRAHLAERVISAVGHAPRRVAVWGLTFKAGTDDLRESPAIDLVTGLLQTGAEVVIHDPQLTALPAGVGGRFAADPVEAARDADAVVVATEWREFAELDLSAVADAMAGTTLVDLRNVFASDAVNAAGLDHYPLGRAAAPLR